MKIKVYAKSVGHRNACMLVQEGKAVPSTHTPKEPLAPKMGFSVVWNEGLDAWKYQAIPDPEPETAS